MPQLHIPAKIRKDPEACQRLYGNFWRRPKLLCDVEALEILYGPPETILTHKEFRPYQRWMHNAIIGHKAVFLGAAMGLGKTGATLSAMVELLDAGIVSKVLIVAPLNVAENTWPEEIQTWAFARHLEYSVITGDLDERIAATQAKADVYMVNRENLPWLQKFLLGRSWIFDMLVYDEASRLKGGAKKTDKERISEFGVLSRMQFKFKKIVLLSGTPTPNGLTDLWGPIYICDKGFRLGTSRSAYLSRYFSYDEYTRKYSAFEETESAIMNKVKDIFYVLKERDYLTLPPMMFRDHHVTLPPKAMEMYRRLERDSVLEELDIEAVNSGVLTNKLLQLTNGSLYLTDHTAEHVHDEKLNVLDSILAEAFGQPVMVAYSFKFDKDRIKKRFPHARIYGENKNDNRDWNAGKIPLLVLHPASAGHGLNFQHGGNIAVWYGLTWSLELYLQFIKRLHRSGQKADHVMMHRIMAKSTVDMNVLRALTMKDAHQDAVTEAVRVRLERVQGIWQQQMAA
jgi:SNF2 family DNA or RNA helicase